MSAMRRDVLSGTLVGLAVLLLTLGCQNSSREVRPWRASDHDQADSQDVSNQQTALGAPAPEAPAVTASASPHSVDGMPTGNALQLWIGKCLRCHGQVGAGDGPDGPATGARNLTDDSWQASVSDRRIADSIVQGRGRMPSFPLDPESTRNLVNLVRQMGSRAAAVPPTVPSTALEAPAASNNP